LACLRRRYTADSTSSPCRSSCDILSSRGAWAAGTSPGGSNTQVQFNNSGAFGGDSSFVWDNMNKRLGIGTPSPQAPLDITTSYTAIRLLTGTNTSAYALSIGVNDDGVNFTNNSAVRGFNFKNANGSLMSIDSSGKVGIGTTSPAALPDVVGGQARIAPGASNYASSFTGPQKSALAISGSIGTGEYARLTFGNAVQGNYGGMGLRVENTGSYLSFGTSNNYNSGITNEAMTIDPVGKVGIGTTSPASALQIGNGTAYTQVTISGWTSGGGSSALTFQNSLTTKYNIFLASANNCLSVSDVSSGGMYMCQGGTSWVARSDSRLKKNVHTYSVLDRLKDYRAVSFDWKQSGKHEIGVIAQEIYKAFPEVVRKGSEDPKDNLTGATDPRAWGVSYDRLGALALQAVKELQAENEHLRRDVDELRQRDHSM